MVGDFDRDWERPGKGKQNNQDFMPGASVHQYINGRIRRAYEWIVIIH